MASGKSLQASGGGGEDGAAAECAAGCCSARRAFIEKLGDGLLGLRDVLFSDRAVLTRSSVLPSVWSEALSCKQEQHRAILLDLSPSTCAPGCPATILRRMSLSTSADSPGDWQDATTKQT